MEQGESSEVRAVCRALVEELERGRKLLIALTDEEYSAEFEELELRSIGAHHRHVLDSCAAFLSGHPAGAIDYRRRGRSRVVENQRSEGVARADLLMESFATFVAPDTRVEVRDTLEPGKPPVVTRSTDARELLFLLEHMVHHHAMMRVCARGMGVRVPAEFGVAPSTLEALGVGSSA